VAISSIFSEVPGFCLHLLKVKETVENFKNLQRSSPIFALSIHTTFSQTQTGATVPLRTLSLYCLLKEGHTRFWFYFNILYSYIVNIYFSYYILIPSLSSLVAKEFVGGFCNNI
jgi:hypothetical protein